MAAPAAPASAQSPTLASDGATTLTFTPGNPCNTTITSPSGTVWYRVHTEFRPETITHVKNIVNDEEIGALEWRETLSDRVTIRGEKTVSYSSWMHKSYIPFKEEVGFSDGAGRKYKWRGSGHGRSPELYSADDNFTAPIARYTRTYRKRMDPDPQTGKPVSVNTPGELALFPRALEIQDLVVLTLLFQEKQFNVSHGGGGTGRDSVPSTNVDAAAAVAIDTQPELPQT